MHGRRVGKRATVRPTLGRGLFRAGRRPVRARAASAVVPIAFRVVAPRCLAESAARDDGLGNLRREQPDRPQRIVVAGDHEVDFVGIAVGVHDADDGNLELARLVDRDLLLARVDHEQGVGQAAHMTDAFEVLLQLPLFLLELRDFLLRERLVAAVGLHRLEIPQARETALDRREVGEEPAQPPLIDEEHARALCFLGDRVLRLALRADEQHGAPVGGEVRDEFFGVPEQLRGFGEVDDVDPVPLAEDVRLHLRVPALGLVSEMDACLEQILQRNTAQRSSINH